ncbi:DNA-processing protein DprA [Opitutus terrae]|uniref:DNA protecting protein DprA n=1 Tax=Opitutus terrae (strain DSM 11246 / JCM 15787 / PB90-1) TaxID=452637 RepID=B1ZNA2_OPITP|nr:DNA-processing protein DprA [Opitutus terrae]ACB73471.1 DNA protecting protein DprA [Opitutus terrae PB90-1]
MNPSELTERQALLVLNALPNIGPVTLNRLLAELGGDPRAALAASAKRMEAVRGVGPVISATLTNWREHFDLAREEERMAKSGADFITTGDAGYPKLLKEIHDPPIGLYRKGRYGFEQPCIAIVGSRRTTLYGQATAKKLGAELARLGFCVVSGLARGIDTAAHEGALSVGGKTAAVVGCGIDIIYPPENLALYRQIEATGAVLSEFPFGRRADRQSFPMRNRVVAGMCEAVIVVETDVNGGAMITARFAGEYGRLIFAVPGRIDQPTSAGCHQLIRDGATLLTSVDDVLNELSYLGGLRPAAIPPKEGSADPESALGVTPSTALTPEEAAIWECFRGGAMLTPDAIIAQTRLGSPQVSAALMMLELKRLIAKRSDGAFEARG